MVVEEEVMLLRRGCLKRRRYLSRDIRLEVERSRALTLRDGCPHGKGGRYG